MTNEQRLTRRGWRSAGGTTWIAPYRYSANDTLAAQYIQDAEDMQALRAHGSVFYVPTDDQRYGSPTCAAMAAVHATERDVIEALFQENVRLRAEMTRLAMALPPPMVITGIDR